MTAMSPNFVSVTPKTIIAVGAVLPSLAAIAVSLRFYVRIRLSPSVGLDDWLILVSLILTVALGVMLIVGSAMGVLAQPLPLGDDPSPTAFLFFISDKLIAAEKMKYAFNSMQVLILGLMKLSVIIFYRRIFRGKIFDLCSKATITIVGVWTTSFIFTYLFGCGTKFWALWSALIDLTTYCADATTIHKTMSISDVITDIIILSIPLPNIWKLKLSFGKKLAVSSVFLLGTLAVGAGIARLAIFISQLNDGLSLPQGILLISTWMYWSMIELGISITAACLPTLRPLFGELSSNILSNTLRSLFSLRSFSILVFTRRTSSKIPGDPESSSNASQTEFVHKGPSHDVETEIHALRDLEADGDKHPGRILVQNSITHSSSTM